MKAQPFLSFLLHKDMGFNKVIRPNQEEISLVIKHTIARWIKKGSRISRESILQNVFRMLYKEIVNNKGNAKSNNCVVTQVSCTHLHWAKK